MPKYWINLIAVFTMLCAIGASAVYAQGRPDSRRMTCNQAYNLVQRHGAVVMSTGRYTFERVVASRRWCQMEEILERYYVPTLDDHRCRVGYKCVPGVYERDN